MTVNGEGLAVVVRCKNVFAHDWMAFAAWYSFSKLVPDALISLQIDKSMKTDRQLFSWTIKMGVKVSMRVGVIFTTNPTIVLDCDTVMVRDLTEGQAELLGMNSTTELPAELVCQAKEELFVPFVSYREGCGNFVESDWINTMECPFPWADRFMTHSANANEVRILKLWKQLSSIYATVSRG